MNKLFEEAMPYVETKVSASKRMSEISKRVKDITKFDSEDISLYKDIIHYKSLGWTETPISKPDPNVQFKDRVSPCFRRMAEIIRVCKAFGDVEILKEYIEAMREEGIDITIRNIPNNIETYNDTKELMKEMDRLQGIICHNANVLRDMGIVAEDEELCPKSKFKDLAESVYKIQDNPKVAEYLHKTVADNLFHNHGIKEALEEDHE